ncbi:MAG: lipid-transfer protein, partial [Hyphomonadaceae bacterium]
FDEMRPGPLGGGDDGRTVTVDHIWRRFDELGYPINTAMAAPSMFGSAGADYMQKYDAPAEIFAEVAVKTRRHAGANPMALFDKPLSVEEVMSAPVLHEPYLTRLMACPPTCGAAAAIVVSPAFARRKGVKAPIAIAGQGMTTDAAATYGSAMDLVGREMSARAARIAFEEAGLGPRDVQVVEMHDCFTPNEVINYEALGLCGEGEAAKMIADGDNTYGGRVVTNPSGGLMSKGHPLGATGLAQCTELVQQLRGLADKRQVEGVRNALQHNIGLGGAAVVTVYQRA